MSPAAALRRRPQDQDARDRARFELARNVVVEAGAGTGKTTLLTDRLLFALLAGGPEGRGIPLTRLVALTFTEKAAGEVQVRLASRLADLAVELAGEGTPGRRSEEAQRVIEEARTRFALAPEKVRAAVGAALEHMDRALIGTIHHFAAHLLRLRPLEAGVDPGFEVDAGQGFEELFEAEWALWLDAELGERAPRRDEWLAVLPLAGLGDLAALARSLCAEEARQCRPGATKAMRGRLSELAVFLRGLAGRPKPKGTSKILEVAAEAAARLGDLALACDGRGPWPERIDPARLSTAKWPKAWEEGGEETYAEAVRLAEASAGDEERLLRRATALVQPFAERFVELHRRRGLVSYFGLLRRARDLVKGDARAREELKGRFGALFIDEFQDTDPVQGELLLYLAEKRGRSAGRWDGIELEPGKLFVVGDPKQSIYRFRGADIRAYQEFTRLLLSQGAVSCELQTSFRSHAGLVGPVNAALGRLMRPVEGLQPSYLPIQPHRADVPERGVELGLVRADGSAEEVRAREAAWIAAWIQAECGPGKPRKYRDVAILLRAATALGVYLDALKAAGVPYAVEADRHFYGTQEIVDLLNLLRVLDDPEDRLSLAGLVRSPLAVLDDRELYELSAAGRLDYRLEPPATLAKPARERLTRLWRALRALREAAGTEPLGSFVARVFRETFLVELASAAYFGEQTASNLLKFARIAAEAGDARGATLKEFIGLVERSVRDLAEEGESPLADEHLDAVRLLTIHKAKGLEWPVVILANLGARPRGGEAAVMRFDWASGALGLALPKARAADAAMAFLELDGERRERHEAVRLLYVAMTRARERLVLTGAEEPRSGSFAALLAEANAWPGALPVSFIEEGGEAAAARPRGPEVAELESPAAFAEAWKRRLALRAEALAPAATSATHLAAQSPSPRRGGGRGEGHGDASRAKLIGVVCHRVLQDWDYRAGGDAASAARSACRLLEREGALGPLAEVEAESAEVLAGFLAGPVAAEIASADILGRELPFVYAEGGAVVRGSIDLLYRSKGRLWVADYKTERAAKAQAKELARRHAAQAKVYRDAVRRALGEECGFRLLLLRAGVAVDL